MIPSSTSCIWECGSTHPFNDEHIIGKHVAKALAMPFPVAIEWGDQDRGTGQTLIRGTRSDNGLEIVLKDRVCERCNNGWMRKLDRKMLRFMEGTLRTEARVQLKRTEQETLALWATKVGLLLPLWLHDWRQAHPKIPHLGRAAVPLDNFPPVYRRQKPPDRTRVWIAAISPYAPVREIGVLPSPLHVVRRVGEQPTLCAYFTIIHLKRLVFVVSGWALSHGDPIVDYPELALASHDRRAFRRIWPVAEQVTEWPPPAYLEPESLNALVREAPSSVES